MTILREGDTQGWRRHTYGVASLLLGASLALFFGDLMWRLATEPATCDTRRLPGGSFVHPLCAPPAAPIWLIGLITLGGALVGYSLYRFARDRRFPGSAIESHRNI